MRTIIRNNYDPHIGDYHERIIQDEAREKTWLFDCDGVYLDITAGRGDVKVVNELGDSEVDATSQKLVTDELGKKQDALVAGDNITIEGNVISAAGKNYSAGYGLTLNDTEFAADTSVLATKTDLAGKQDALSQAQLAAVNSGIDSGKVGQIATNASDIDTIEAKIPAQATSSNQLADKDFVNSSVATNTANYISNNGEPFTSLAQLEAYSGDLSNNDYAFVVGTDSAGNTTYTRYKYVADTQEWAEEYVLNNSSFTANQWAAINSGITSGDVTKLSGIEAGAEVNAIDSISVNGTAVTPDANKNVDLTIDEGIKTLTTADYNYPASNPTSVAVWLLPTGTYLYKGDINIDTNSAGTIVPNTVISVRNTGGNRNKNVLMFIVSDLYNMDFVSVAYANTGSITRTEFFSDIIDNLTTSTGATRLFPLSANQGKVLKDLIDSIAIRGAGAPTTSTVGTVGQLYEDGTNGVLYQLKSIDITVTPNTYNWEEVGGGSGPTVVQTTGTSTTDVMSQNAVTEALASAGGIKTLTTEDYNYPTSGTKYQIALWLLEPGIYKSKTSGSSLQITPAVGTNVTLDGEEIVIITKAGGNSILSIYPYNHASYKGLKMFAADSSTGAKKSLAGFDDSILTTGSVYDNLDATYNYLPLSANMGKTLSTRIGDLSTLTTTDKTSTVAAINELVTRVAALEGN